MTGELAVPGFEFGAVASGIKGRGVPDLALIRSVPPATAVALFTRNQVRAAPVLVSAQNARRGRCSVVIINSGNANACTGRRGLRDAVEMVRRTAALLGVSQGEVLVCSTGRIGIPLPMESIRKALPRLVRSLIPGGLTRAARAILTTDAFLKVASYRGRVGRCPFRLIGFAKGAGMIAPDLAPHATMLAFFTTDLKIERRAARNIFQRVADQTFNRITVDGDTSTNDTALLLANGLAGNREVRGRGPGARVFARGLEVVMRRLALMMVEDGEGATKCVKVEVMGAKDNREATRIARAIGNSPLVKTSFFGEDPNWGRILAAAGRAGTTWNPEKSDIYYEGVRVVRRGVSAGGAALARAKRVMKKRRFAVRLDLRRGRGRGSVWASDLSLGYVKLNAHYRT